MTATRSQQEATGKRSALLPSKDQDNASQDVGGVRDEPVIDTFVVVPPDGGWGWVVVVGSFISNFVVDGIIFAFGMYLGVISEALNESKTKISLVGSLLTGFYMMVGPFVSALANRYGFRMVAAIGSFIGTGGFILSYYASSANYLIFSIGLVGGIGFGLIYIPAVIVVGFYFERWRALATSIAVCGSGMGTVVLPPLINILLDNYGWRGSFLVLAGLIFNTLIPALVYRPLKPIKLTISEAAVAIPENKSAKPEESIPLMLRIKQARDEQFHKSGSLSSVRELTSQPTADVLLARRRIIKAHNNNAYPTTSQIIARSLLTLHGSRMASSHSLDRVQSGNNPTDTTLSGMTISQKRLSAPPYSTTSTVESHDSSASTAKGASPVMDLLKPLQQTQDMNDKDSESNLTLEQRMIMQSKSGRVRTMSESSRTSHRSKLGGSRDVGVRPMYRSDIFYGSSLKRLPQYTSQMSSVGYHMSVSHLPTKEDILEEKAGRCKLCPEAVQRTLATMLDMSLFKSYTFMLLNLSGSLTMMGFYIPYMFITDRARLGGMEESMSMWLVPAIGITNTVARIVCGVLTSLPGINALAITSIALTLGGIGTMISGLYMSTAYQFAYCCVFGFAAACFASLRSIVIVDLLGLDKLTNAFGLLLLFQGVAACIGSPLAGAFMELTGGYDASFYLSGTLILVSAVMLYPLNYVNRWEKKRNERRPNV